MKYINVSENPIDAVDAVVLKLRRLSGLCYLMAQARESHGTVDVDSVSDAMYTILEILDEQVETLEAIQFPKQRVVSA